MESTFSQRKPQSASKKCQFTKNCSDHLSAGGGIGQHTQKPSGSVITVKCTICGVRNVI